ncbi:TPA: ribose-5-phosphate isomerase [Candidatus Uhrbacteria bacterium]|nr:ribose-5-phosphate isomerase [Candidatus Uhrbacteria bacterium]
MLKTIYLGADHAGFNLKNSLKEHLELQGHIVHDLGAHHLDPHDDYPPIAAEVAATVREHPSALGILVCGSAEGVAIAANKFDGIRAGVGFSVASAVAMRNDDDANILCLPARLKLIDDPLAIADAFLTTPFSNAERHNRRLDEISDLEDQI